MGRQVGNRAKCQNHWDGLSLTAQTADGDSAVPIIETYYIKGRFAGNLTLASAPPAPCRVPGCTSDLSRDVAYFRKYRICREHLKCPIIAIEGVPSRFCQQCSRFHNVRDFDGPQRTCRTMLERLRMKRNGNTPCCAGGGCSRRGKRKDVQRAATQQHASSSRSTFSGKEWEAPAPSDAAVHPPASGNGADSAAVMAVPLPGGTSARANSASSGPNNLQPLKRPKIQRTAGQGLQHEMLDQDTRQGTVDEAAMSGPIAAMIIEAAGNGANGVGAAAADPQVGMLQLLLMHNSDSALLPLLSCPTIGATASADAPTTAAGDAAVVSGTVAAATGSAGAAAVGFSCDGALHLHRANNQAQAKIQTVSSSVLRQSPYGSNTNATSGGIGVRPLLVQRSEHDHQNQRDGMRAYGVDFPGQQCSHAEAGLLRHTLAGFAASNCSCGSSRMATDSELEMQLRAIYQEMPMAMGDEAPLLPLRHQLFLHPQAQQLQQKHPLVTASSAPPCIPLQTSSWQSQPHNLLQTAEGGVIPVNVRNAAPNDQAGPPHLPATPPSAAFQDLLPLLMDMEVKSASSIPVGAGGMGGLGGVPGITAGAEPRAAALQQQQTRGVEAVSRLHGGLPGAHALQQQHAMGTAFVELVESEPWQPAAAPCAQPFANVTRMSYGSVLNIPCLAASGSSIPASGLTLLGSGGPNIPMSGLQLARPGGANLPSSRLATPAGSASAWLQMTGLTLPNSCATNLPLPGFDYPGSGPAVCVSNTASARAAVPAAATYAGEKAMQVLCGGDFTAADAAAAGDSSGCCPGDIDAALEALMEDAGPGAVYSNYEHEVCSVLLAGGLTMGWL